MLKPLDFETGRDYFLTVEAWDGGTPPLSAATTININLTDVNDNSPVFSSDLYTAAVSEDAAVGTFIVQVGLGQHWLHDVSIISHPLPAAYLRLNYGGSSLTEMTSPGSFILQRGFDYR